MPKVSIAARRLATAGAQSTTNTYLLRRRVSPRTLALYQKSHNEFLEWTRWHGRSFTDTDEEGRDNAMLDYMHYLFFLGEPAYAARMALFGHIHVANLNSKDPLVLPLSRQGLRGYGVAAPEQQRDPLPWEAAVLIADFLARRGDPQSLDAARAVVILYDGFLRPSELLGLRCCDIHVLGRRTGARYGKVATTIRPSAVDDGSLPLPRTKAGDYDDTVTFGDTASASAGRGFVAPLLMALKAAKRGTQRLLSLTLPQLDQCFADAVAALGLQRLRATPHCCRHGGASTDFSLKVRSLDEVQRRGRWKAHSSVRRYEKAGRLTRQLSFLSRAQLKSANITAIELPSLLTP